MGPPAQQLFKTWDPGRLDNLPGGQLLVPSRSLMAPGPGNGFWRSKMRAKKMGTGTGHHSSDPRSSGDAGA